MSVRAEASRSINVYFFARILSVFFRMLRGCLGINFLSGIANPFTACRIDRLKLKIGADAGLLGLIPQVEHATNLIIPFSRHAEVLFATSVTISAAIVFPPVRKAKIKEVLVSQN